jgi:poly(3-hydroxybutyrate) depolymerase
VGVPATRQFHFDAVGAGHYGIFSGRRWREKVYPEVRGFIQRFNQPAEILQLAGAQTATKAPAKSAPRKRAQRA